MRVKPNVYDISHFAISYFLNFYFDGQARGLWRIRNLSFQLPFDGYEVKRGFFPVIELSKPGVVGKLPWIPQDFAILPVARPWTERSAKSLIIPLDPVAKKSVEHISTEWSRFIAKNPVLAGQCLKHNSNVSEIFDKDIANIVLAVRKGQINFFGDFSFVTLDRSHYSSTPKYISVSCMLLGLDREGAQTFLV